MDSTRFDRLVAALARPASRRTALTTLLGGALVGKLAPAAAAHATRHRRRPGGAHVKARPCPTGQKPCHGHCISQRQPCGQPGGGCTDNGQPCQQDRQCCSQQCANGVCAPKLGCADEGESCAQNSDCCGGNCFQQVCAAKVSTCGNTTCNPSATGCCPVDGCCQPPANQCNRGLLCCAPNCTGKQCGPDGCGGKGTCGTCAAGQICNPGGRCVCTPQSCPPGTTCDKPSGQCQCTPESCPNGCCSNGPGNTGTCEPGNTDQSCNRGGARCVACATGLTCAQPGCQPVDCAAMCTPPAFCLNTVDGSSVCSHEQSPFCSPQQPNHSLCAATADCPSNTYNLCVVSYTDATTNQTVANSCFGFEGALCTASF